MLLPLFFFLLFILLWFAAGISGEMLSRFSSWTAGFWHLAGHSSPDPAAVVQELENLELLCQRNQSLVDDADGREVRDELERQYLSELREIVLDAEDVLDEWRYELLRAEVEGGKAHKRRRGEASDQAARLLADDAPLRDRLSCQIGDITRRFEEISRDSDALRLGKGDGVRRRGAGGETPSSSLVVERYVCGRDVDTDVLVGYMLSDDCASSDLSVIPIVGMGLVGKTTLAQVIYNDPDVEDNFHPRGWVSLTKGCDLKRLLGGAVESLTSRACCRDQLDAVQATLQQCVEGKRFLLVLDDVGDEHLDFWGQFQASLGSCLQGSVVLITTKIEEVAMRTRTTPLIYFLESISEDNCWSTFQRYAFDGRHVAEGPDMAVIRRRVVEICEGIPWVAKLLGISFRNRRQGEDWMDSMEDAIENEIQPALQASYRSLPAYLRPCLLYCSLFPRGYLFTKGQLVQRWMAQGLVLCAPGRKCLTPSKNGKRPEDISLQYFRELLSRSFFLQSKTNGEEYFMPNLICDLVCSISGNGYNRVEYLQNLSMQDRHLLSTQSKVRHLSLALHESKSKLHCESVYGHSSLRSFLVLQKSPFPPIVHLESLHEMLLKLNRMRSLDLSYTSIRALPDSIGSLKHLRFLALNHTKIMKLPESIDKLYNLLTLELKYCPYLQELPRGIDNLTKLRHLSMDSDLLIYMPLGIQKLTCLQKLPTLNLCTGEQFCGIRELQDLTDIGELRISGLCNVTNLDDAMKANMQNKTHLKILILIWPSNDVVSNSERFGDSEHQYFENLAEENEEEDKLTVDEQPSDQEKSSSCDVVISDEEESNFGSNLTNGIDNMDGQVCVSSDAAVHEENVLESLRPFTNLEKLYIKHYGGVKFPGWIGDSSFSKLKFLELTDCKDAKPPPLGRLPNLMFLGINGMSVKLRWTDLRGEGNAIAFPKLETLSLHNVSNWEDWEGLEKGDFPNLNRLCLFNCPLLRNIPDLLSSLKILEVERCMKLTDIPKFPKLESLEVWYCDGLRALPPLASLHGLKIMSCQKLKSLPLPIPENAQIEDCQQLRSP